MPRFHNVVRTGDGAALPFYFSSNYEINFANTMLAEGFDRFDPTANLGFDGKLGTGGLNRARCTMTLVLVIWLVGGLILNLLCWCLLVFAARGLLFTAHG